MASAHDSDLDELLGGDDDGGTVLPSFAVTARYRRPAASAEQAEQVVRADLTGARGLYDDLRVEPQEPDGRWAVDVRLVSVSLDGETAVAGVYEALREAGAPPDECWLSERL